MDDRKRTKSQNKRLCYYLLRSLCQKLPDNKVNNIYIGSNSPKSLLPVGANYRACLQGKIKARDFINKLQIVEEETG